MIRSVLDNIVMRMDCEENLEELRSGGKLMKQCKPNVTLAVNSGNGNGENLRNISEMGWGTKVKEKKVDNQRVMLFVLKM